jgi:hypothetical protein
MSGTGENQQRDITESTQATSTITITPNWATNPSTDSIYKIVRSFSKKIENCFEKLQQMLYDKGQRHELILESSQIKVPLVYLVIHFICLDLMDNRDDKWGILAEEYWKKFESAFTNLKLEYDEDESLTITGDEGTYNPNRINIGRG